MEGLLSSALASTGVQVAPSYSAVLERKLYARHGVAVSIDLFSCNGAHARGVSLRNFYDLLIVLDCKVMHGIIKFITLRSYHL